MLWYLQWVLSHSVYNRSLTATLQRAPAQLAHVSAFTTLCFLAYLCKPHSRFGKLLGLRKSMQVGNLKLVKPEPETETRQRRLCRASWPHLVTQELGVHLQATAQELSCRSVAEAWPA